MIQASATQQRSKQTTDRNKIRRFHLNVPLIVIIAVVLAGVAISAQDKYSVKVPGGLAF